VIGQRPLNGTGLINMMWGSTKRTDEEASFGGLRAAIHAKLSIEKKKRQAPVGAFFAGSTPAERLSA
jgi:hypothetical protein